MVGGNSEGGGGVGRPETYVSGRKGVLKICEEGTFKFIIKNISSLHCMGDYRKFIGIGNNEIISKIFSGVFQKFQG